MMGFQPSGMQPSEEELATLLSRQLTFQQTPSEFQVPQPTQEQQHRLVPKPEPIEYSISQHYNHSAHVVKGNEFVPQAQRSFSEAMATQPSAEEALTRHGIDPSGLSPPQLELFKTADAPQQIRLIELWQIYPPKRLENEQSLAWSATTVEKEEHIAEQKANRTSLMSLDGTPLTPIQSSDGHWVNTAYVEPYMMSGYAMLARDYQKSAMDDAVTSPGEVFNELVSLIVHNPRATDPVYATDWAYRESLESQYRAMQGHH
ncbi:hypothetical protein GGS20DRAFT_561331 [Poronia punctata]|nr:hypothetical protein GGS20DRAFT_561331 [Poronia punctata]